MAAIKTQPTGASVKDFLNSNPDEEQRKDSLRLFELYEEVTGEKGQMWGTAIVGFGQFHYKSERSSQQGEWFFTGFSPRAGNLTLYMMSFLDEGTIKKLGKCKKSGSCLHIKKLADVDEKLLKKLIADSVTETKKNYKL